MCALPVNYEIPSKESDYFKPQDGDNRVRVLSDIKPGYLYWTTENKPVRLKERPQVEPSNMREDSTIKHMWLCLVWDYEQEKVCIWEVTQATIQGAIVNLEHDADYGDVKNYDLKIKREGKDLETKYHVTPSPVKDLTEDIVTAFEESDLTEDSLEAMFTSESVDIDEPSPEDSPF